MNPQEDALRFHWPPSGLFPPGDILTAAHILNPQGHVVNGKPTLLVIKHSSALCNTTGRLNRFGSYTRYFCGGITFGSVEVTVYTYIYKPKATTFSEGGDSGSIIIRENH